MALVWTGLLSIVIAAAQNNAEIMVKFRPEVTEQARNALLARHGMTIVTTFQSIGVFVVRLPAGMTVPGGIQILSKDPSVQYAEPIAQVRAEAPKQELRVRFKKEPGADDLKRLGMTIGRRVERDLYLVKIPDRMTVKEAVEVLKKHPDVVSAEPHKGAK
jgi:hypothetical protein